MVDAKPKGYLLVGTAGASQVAQWQRVHLPVQKTPARPLGREDATQYSCLENSMDRRAWQATVHWVTKE